MCNLYSLTKGQAAIIALVRAMRDTTGNLPPMPGIFPDYLAPVVRNAPDGVRELAMARWGMPCPPRFGGAPITNIRNVKSPYWRRWLRPESRCVVPFTSFCEYADTKPRKTPTWFAFDNSRPLAVFAGVWTTWHGKRGTKANPVEGEQEIRDGKPIIGGSKMAKRVTRRETLAIAGTALAALTIPAAAQSANPIKIGFSMALTGGLAIGGRAALLAYQIWAEDLNAKGGLLGRKVELVYFDDQTNPSTVPAIYAKLLDVDKVDLVVSGYGTVPTAAAMPVIMRSRKLFLSLFALAANDQFGYDRYFQLQPNGPEAKYEFSKGFFELATKLTPKAQSVALVGADAEFSILALQGARENAKKAGINLVFDRTYPPSTIDFAPIVRSIKALNPDLLFIASYPPDSVGMIRSIHEVGFGARMVGGGMIGLQFAALKQQLGPMLNNIVCYDLYVPEPTMKFPGIEEFLVKYRERAAQAGVDPLGNYIPPFAYSEMQILETAIKAVGSTDDQKLADYIRSTSFKTVVGDIKFGARGEWAEPRILLIQYRGIVGNDLDQFKQPGKQVILHPSRFKSGELHVPFESIKN